MLSASASLSEPLEILNATTQTFADARAADPSSVSALGHKLKKLEDQRRKFNEDSNDKIRSGLESWVFWGVEKQKTDTTRFSESNETPDLSGTCRFPTSVPA